jgi:hypothetical protein
MERRASDEVAEKRAVADETLVRTVRVFGLRAFRIFSEKAPLPPPGWERRLE